MGRTADAALFSAGPWYRRLRLGTGCLLFAYVLTHLLDHATGNISLAAMEAVLRLQKVIWQGTPGTVLLYGALVIHASLGVWSLYARRYVGWTALEVVQLAFGLCIPALLANHIAVTRGALDIFGIDKAYAQELATLWVVLPILGLVQVTVLVVAWAHACIGLHTAFRLKRWYGRARAPLLAVAVLIPVLALLGFAASARDVERRMDDPAWRAEFLSAARTGTDAQVAYLFDLRNRFIAGYALLVAAVLLARVLRVWAETGRRGVAIRFPDGRVARVPTGLTVLDASRMVGFPHASACGGRGRCSTCRIRVMAGDAREVPRLPPPSPSERAVLLRVGADPATVRLACQLRPRADVTVLPLVPKALAGSFIVGRENHHLGEERFVVAMFVDMRGSTRVIEGRLPYDAVFLLRRFVETAVAATHGAGGVPSVFTGDGFLALFGLESDRVQACRAALDAVLAIDAAMRALGAETAAEMAHPLGYSIGAQCGRAVVGEVAFRDGAVLTALGEVVHTAARLEAATRMLDCDAVVGAEILDIAGLAWPAERRDGFTVRGRAAPLSVRLIRVAELREGVRQPAATT